MCVRGLKQNLLKLLNTPVMSNTVLPHCYGPLKAALTADRTSVQTLSIVTSRYSEHSYEACISCVITSGHNRAIYTRINKTRLK